MVIHRKRRSLGRTMLRGIYHARVRANSYFYPKLAGFACGPATAIEPGAVIDPTGGMVQIGANCFIHNGAKILAYGGHITMGDSCSVNPYTILYGHGGLSVGDCVLIAAHVVIIPSNHNIALGRPIREQGSTAKGIVIESDVWIGAGARILDGAHIEQGAVVAAGAVVTEGRVSANAIVGGVPARVLRCRS